MAATVTTTITTSLTGLGNDDTLNLAFSPSAPAKSMHGYRQTSSATTEEALDSGTITATAITGLYIRAIDYGLEIDCKYTAATFRPSFVIKAGQAAYLQPTGPVYVRSYDQANKVNYEYLAVG